ncbi:choline-sulfatase [SAR116 cluster alpha proteobacterium HIMB100]|nr:choline-sulfatase [SAR116 cluster alpha proteobacterium HIMB100]
MEKPNILIIMTDQLNGTLFPEGRPAPFLHTPHLNALADRSVCFAQNYTASPLCGPGRASFMSGQLPSRTGVYDNAAEFSSAIPTYAHHLRRHGWQCCLSGKMHFVGPDQLHGFEERLTTDIYPADFGWTPDYTKPGERINWWYHNLGSVTGAGVAEITNQMEYDDEVAHFACQKLYQLSRGLDDRPWCLTVSFTHPHDPYVARREFWDLYEDCDALAPELSSWDFDQHDPHSKRLFIANDYKNFQITETDIRRSRQAYFANISYLDEKIGQILSVLTKARMAENTIIIFCSDHGDMLGERGLWFKMSFLEGAARTPLMIAAPRFSPMTVREPVSNLDILPTLADLAGLDLSGIAPWVDGQSLLPLVAGNKRDHPVLMEYAAEGSYAPLVAMVEGRFKFIRCQLDPDQMFDLECDPHELVNLANDPAYAEQADLFRQKIEQKWDLEEFDSSVRHSQAQRLLVYDALRNGAYFPWDYQPLQQASERYMRNHMDLNILEENQRYPRGE